MTSQTTGGATEAHRADATDAPADASTGELVRRLSTQLSELIRSELALARAELTTKGKRIGTGAGLAGAGGVLAFYGGGALVAAAVAGLATVMSVWLAALIVGVVLLAVAGVLALVGKKQIEHAQPPVPEEAVEGLKRDVEAVKGGLQR
jgi:lipopolysaccharide export LptBFGC system permease protein LptF